MNTIEFNTIELQVEDVEERGDSQYLYNCSDYIGEVLIQYA